MPDPSQVPAGQTTNPAYTPASSPAAAMTGVRWLYPLKGARLTWLVRVKTLFGRGEDCDERLPGSETSRHHAEIRRDGPIHIVRDLGSRNGVFANGVRVGEAVLSTGDVLRLGDCIGVVVRGSAETDSLGPSEFTSEHGLVAGPVLGPVLSLARQSAAIGLPIVIQGETGTGKELVARAIHAWSGRPGPFVAINCAALTQSLAEAELFGHRKGAFTGADREALGYFRAADGGTLLLDEICDLPPAVQAKLLRAIERSEVVPVGESRPVAVEVRILTATQVPLRDRVDQGLFRADLEARLTGVVIPLPPLRQRIAELPWLFDWFLRKHSGGCSLAVEARLVEDLCLYSWPRNVRELELLARQLAGLHGHEPRLRRSLLPSHVRVLRAGSSSAGDDPPPEGQGARDARDLATLVRGLRVLGGNVSRAAAEAGISRQRAYRLLAAHPEIDPALYRRTHRSDESDESESETP